MAKGVHRPAILCNYALLKSFIVARGKRPLLDFLERESAEFGVGRHFVSVLRGNVGLCVQQNVHLLQCEFVYHVLGYAVVA